MEIKPTAYEILRCLVGSEMCIRDSLSGALAASGDVWLSGCGVFPSEQAYRVWRKTPEKAADPTLIRKLPDGEIRRYNRRQNIICRECRQSEVMQRVLAFYRGNFQEVM
ncbi:DUF977 family protein, partial [Escherichia coli]